MRVPGRRFDRDGTELARVVTPDASHDQRLAAVGQRQRDVLAHLPAVDRRRRLADPDAGLAGTGGVHFAEQRQRVRGVVDRPHDQRQRRPARVERERSNARRAQLRHPGQTRRLGGEAGRQRHPVGGRGAADGAQVQVGRQHGVQPVRHRVAKARHHHRQRHRQGEACHHAGHRRARGMALVACAPPGQQHQRSLLRQRPRQQQLHDGRHQHHATGQQCGHRAIGGQRQPGHWWQQGQHAGAADQRQTGQRVRAAGAGRRQALQRHRRGQPFGRPRRPPGAQHRRGGTQRTVQQRRHECDLQVRRDAGEVAAAEVAAECTQRDRRQRRTGEQPDHAAQRADDRRLGEHQCAPVARSEAENAEQCKGRRALRDRQREHRVDEKATDQQRHQRQHAQVDAIGARQVGHALQRVVGLRDTHARWPRLAALPGVGSHAGGQPQVDAVDARTEIEA